MVEDVFKFPDGNGGYILKKQGPDGKWHECNEKGNYTEEKNGPALERSSERTIGSARKRASGKRDRKTSLYMENELFKRLRYYCIENNTSMTDAISRAVSEFLSAKKD